MTFSVWNKWSFLEEHLKSQSNSFPVFRFLASFLRYFSLIDMQMSPFWCHTCIMTYGKRLYIYDYLTILFETLHVWCCDRNTCIQDSFEVITFDNRKDVKLFPISHQFYNKISYCQLTWNIVITQIIELYKLKRILY